MSAIGRKLPSLVLNSPGPPSTSSDRQSAQVENRGISPLTPFGEGGVMDHPLATCSANVECKQSVTLLPPGLARRCLPR